MKYQFRSWLSMQVNQKRTWLVRYSLGFIFLSVSIILVHVISEVEGARIYSLMLASAILSAVFAGLGPALIVSIVGAVYLDLVVDRDPWMQVLSVESLVRFSLYAVTSLLMSFFADAMRGLVLDAEQARAEAEAAVKEKDRLMGVIVHDLKNPIGVVKGYSEILREETEDEEHLQYLNVIHQRCDGVLELIDELLDLSSVSQTNLMLRPQDMRAMLQDCIEHHKALARKKNIDLLLELPDQPAILFVDGRRIERALRNILDNAIKYSPLGSTVRVRMEQTEDQLVIAIKDQGPGISKEEQASLFKPFSKTSNQPTGGESSSGLGLSNATQIIEAHGGRLTLVSEVGDGSTFSLSLPSKELAVSTRDSRPSAAFEAPRIEV